jgi:hypothetical protein
MGLYLPMAIWEIYAYDMHVDSDARFHVAIPCARYRVPVGFVVPEKHPEQEDQCRALIEL